MRHSASLILLLWLVMAQLDCTSTANHREALHKARSRPHYLQSVTNRFLVSDGEGGESLSTSSAKEASRISRPPSSDIDAKGTPATGEATQQKSTAGLSVSATDVPLAIHDKEEASVIVEKDRQRSTTIYPTSAAETPVSSRSLGVGGDAKQTSVLLDRAQESTTELPVPVTGAPQGPPVTATIEQRILNLKISITTTQAPEVGDQKVTPPNYTSVGNSKLSVPTTETVQNFTLRSGGDHNWTTVNGSVSPRDQSDPKVHRNNTSQLTPIKPEENKGNLPTERHQQYYGDYPAIIFKGVDEVGILLRTRRAYQDDREEENDGDRFRKESELTLGEERGSQRHGSRGLALLLYPIVSFMAKRAATKVLGTVGGLVSGAASYVAFHPNLLGGANATSAPVGG